MSTVPVLWLRALRRRPWSGSVTLCFATQRRNFLKTVSRAKDQQSYAPDSITFPPYQGHCVHVSMIDSARSSMLSSMIIHPADEAPEYLPLANHSFLIESPHRQTKLLFDLGMMADLPQRIPPTLKTAFAHISSANNNKQPLKLHHLHPVPDMLQSHGVPLSSISAITLSHSHIDHVGDPSLFPPTTSLIVGPGFRSACIPGYPINPSAPILDSAFTNREVHEVSFPTSTPTIGIFPAVDYFSDGSFFILSTPGHTTHHLSALARTTEHTWVFLAADCCHTLSQLRPSEWRPLPPRTMGKGSGDAEIKGERRRRLPCGCAQHWHRAENGEPFHGLAAPLQEDANAAENTRKGLQAFDGRDDVMVFLAHDTSVRRVVPAFPARMNRWKEEGWGEQARWLFLEEMGGLIGGGVKG